MIRRVGFILIISLLAVLTGFMVFRPVLVARSVMEQTFAFQQQQIDKARLRAWAEENSGHIYEADGTYEAIVETNNALLSAFHLAPPTRFVASIKLLDGTPASASVSLQDDSPVGGRTTVSYLFTPRRFFDVPIDEYLLVRNPVGKPPAAMLMVPNTATGEILNIAKTGLNVRCLSRFGGCSPEQQAPEIWRLPRQRSSAKSR